tara:strand:- start:140 stop:820 length:681 start_codon:yes stop_codon:yes gene_type:complete
VALLVWGIIFLFGLSGPTDPSKENIVALSWIGMLIGAIGTFYVGPEFFYYLEKKQVLDDILLLDSRAEVLRRRKEGEEAAIMLGEKYMGMMRGLLELHEIPVGKNLTNSPIINSHSDANVEGNWWNNSDSALSHRLPGLDLIRELFFHRILILITSFSLIMLFWNTIFGIASRGGSREYTIDLTERISGISSFHHLAPHIDPVSIILILFLSFILYLTRPYNYKEI